uniref:uncharacterized protein LOC100176895 isoform X2 n=1 Tax=Ciona intestinalis TaxID=7719 RepID=UPI000EF4E816|nr:uncharacterized protein LOC100176895 isoform X2 [Ciona intestinalis]|eukprot:XP_026695004.1 uncharacterized protein LOC100176895 isoform X2 [Ciona intestinalis]
MTSNYYAYIDAIKTLNETGWEWSTTHDKFYFNTTHRGVDGPFMVMGKYNNWHIYYPNIGGYGMISSYPNRYIWMWRTTEPSLQAHYICQINVKGSTLVAPTAVNIKYGEDSVICSSHGSPGPPVSWKINSEDVSINTSEPVYQIITRPTLNGNTSSRLYFTRALSQNSGVYTCNATSLNQSAQTTVKIDKRPRLLESKLETSTYACKFIGETSPTVYWSVNGVIVKENVSFITNTVLNTHEVLSQVSPLLIFGNKDIVSCWATTTDGSSNKVSKAGFSNPSSSAFIVSPGSCPGNQLQINWTDITKTTGNIVYNVSVTNSVQTYIKTLAQSSTKDNNYSITFDNLTPRTEYTVKIHFFPKYPSKIDQTLGRTAGEKPSIVSASANTDFNKTQCLISWLKGPETGIIGASIVVTSSLNKKALYMSDIVTTVTHTTLSQPYNFQMEPNRKHIITVATKTCSELSQYILVTGKCISQVQAPANIPTPRIVGSYATTSHIQVNKADETNGPISCYLVIGGKKGSKQYRDSYTWMEIQNMKTNSNSSSYCVAVLPRFNVKNLQLGLSSTTTTQCKVDTSHTISCTNKLMSSGITYKFQVVTLSLADGVYLTQTSQPIVATPLASLPSTSKTVTIAIVVALSTLVVSAAAYFIGKRRCDCLKQSRLQKVEFVQPEQALQQDGTNCEEAYVNLEVEQKPKLNKTSYELSPGNSSIQGADKIYR